MFSNFVLFFAHFIRIALFLHNSFSNGNVFFPDGNVSLDAGSYAIIRIQAHLQIDTLNANGVYLRVSNKLRVVSNKFWR